MTLDSEKCTNTVTSDFITPANNSRHVRAEGALRRWLLES